MTNYIFHDDEELELWIADFVDALKSVLEGERKSGSISDYLVDLNGSVVTVKFLQNHVQLAGRGWFGYHIRADDIRKRFNPDTPLLIADAWFYNTFPPGRPVDDGADVTWIS